MIPSLLYNKSKTLKLVGSSEKLNKINTYSLSKRPLEQRGQGGYKLIIHQFIPPSPLYIMGGGGPAPIGNQGRSLTMLFH